DDLDAAARFEDPEDLAVGGVLVRAEVDHAVGDHDVGPAVLDRHLLGVAAAGTRRWPARPRRRWRAPWRASPRSCRRRSPGPSGRPWRAAIRASTPAPEPTATTRSSRLRRPSAKGLPIPANDSVAASGRATRSAGS